MERKLPQPRYFPQKNINRNYITESKIDQSHIDGIYSIFSSGEYNDIIEVLNGNQILNFRNSNGSTLIHAILINPSSTLDEQKIMDIIQKLIVKNVSINAMNEYNQTSLHLASKRGYYNILDLLIELKADLNKVDNYGNSPIHYLIDNFVGECKENEYFTSRLDVENALTFESSQFENALDLLYTYMAELMSNTEA